MRAHSLLDRAILEAGGVTRTAQRGDAAFGWTGRPRTFVFLTGGLLEVRFRTAARGGPWAECRTGSGQDCMPVTAAILSGSQISVRAACKVPSSWLELPAKRFLDLIQGRADVRRALFTGHARRLPHYFARLSANEPSGLNGRLAAWLLAHADEGVMVTTHREIAADLITAREVVSRRLKLFSERGWILQERGRIRITAPAALSRVSRGSFAIGG